MSDTGRTRIWMSPGLIEKFKRLVPRRIAGRRWECRTGRHRSHRALDRAIRCESTPVVVVPAGASLWPLADPPLGFWEAE